MAVERIVPYSGDDDIKSDVVSSIKNGTAKRDKPVFVTRCEPLCRFITGNIYRKTLLVEGKGMFEDFVQEVMIENMRMYDRATSEPDYLNKITTWQAFLHMRARNAIRLYWEKNLHPASGTSQVMRRYITAQSMATHEEIDTLEAARRLGTPSADIMSVSSAPLEDYRVSSEDVEDVALGVALQSARQEFEPDLREGFDIWVSAILEGATAEDAFAEVRDIFGSQAVEIVTEIKLILSAILAQGDF